VVSKKRCLIIGINSFLATQVANKLVTGDVTITGVYRSKREKINANIFEKIISYSEIDQLKDEYTYVFVLAAYIPYGKFNNPDEKLIGTNIEPVLKAHRLFPSSKIILASSVSIYGENKELINEDSFIDKPSLYGLSKLAAEAIVRNHARYSIVRYSSIYGLGMNQDTFIPKIISSAKKEKNISVWGDGSRKQDYIHVSDAAELMIKAASHNENDIFLGVCGNSESNLDVAGTVQSLLPETKISFTGSDNSLSRYYDAAKTKNILKFESKTSLLSGLKEMIL
jgi:UDP-glucose 4-epimerase